MSRSLTCLRAGTRRQAVAARRSRRRSEKASRDAQGQLYCGTSTLFHKWYDDGAGFGASRRLKPAARIVVILSKHGTRIGHAMLKITIFGGHDGRLGFDNQVYVTVFGMCELEWPTLASRLLAQRLAERAESETAAIPGRRYGAHVPEKPTAERPKPFFFTMFANTEIKSPTLAEEFVDLHEAIESGSLTIEEVDRALGTLSQAEPSIGSLTIFGGFEENKLPAEDEEVDTLAVQRHLGNVSERTSSVLQLGIGQRAGERRATILQALMTEAHS